MPGASTPEFLLLKREQRPKCAFFWVVGRVLHSPGPWPNSGAPVPPLVPTTREEGPVSYTFMYWTVYESILCSRDQYREERPLIPGNTKRKLFLISTGAHYQLSDDLKLFVRHQSGANKTRLSFLDRT